MKEELYTIASAKMILWGVEDLDRAIDDPTEKNVVHSAAVLRKLLINEDKFIHGTAAAMELPVRFRVIDQKIYDEIRASEPSVMREAMWRWNSIHPGHAPKAQTVDLKMSQFLDMPIGQSMGEYVSVRSIVKLISNHEGGVHLGTPIDPVMKNLQSLNQYVTFMGTSPIHSAMIDICEITSAALRPIVRRLTTVPGMPGFKPVSYR